MNSEFEAVIGLEVHAELRTATKIFCACPTAFGAEPNTQCCPICMGMPGTMPRLNRHAVELAVRAGLALGCEIAEVSYTDRKHYFYPDLPKAYQISQDAVPLCKNGSLAIPARQERRTIGITRIHIEEDAGKLIHRGGETLIDCNRCGVPLIEIVSAPDIRSAAEASAYLRALRGILLACGVSDCRMQEGSLRCDVNLSLRRRGSSQMGVRTEIKNLNSFAFVEKAIAYEIERQSEVLRHGGALQAETRRYDVPSGKTQLMRVKERAIDYRFLPEPDLPPIHLSRAWIESVRASLPELPSARAVRLVSQYAISPSDAAVLVTEPALADYYEQAAASTEYSVLLVHLLLTDLLRSCMWDPFRAPVLPERLAELAQLLGQGTVNSATAKKLLARLTQGDFSPRKAVADEHLEQITDPARLSEIVREVLRTNPRAVHDYQNGKTAALRALQGQAMAKTAGRAEPRLLEQLLLVALTEENQT